MLCISLDDLAGIKRRHGRFAADAALIHAAKTLSRLIRSTDLLARVGDDQFGLILDHLDHNSAIETAERLACCIAGTPLDLGGSNIAVSASIGVATITAGDTAAESSAEPPATWRWPGRGNKGRLGGTKSPPGHVSKAECEYGAHGGLWPLAELPF